MYGYAYTKKEKELEKERRKRFNKIRGKNFLIIENVNRTYGRVVYRGRINMEIEEKEDMILSELDIAMLCDYSPIPYGAECTRNGDKFKCTIYTD